MLSFKTRIVFLLLVCCLFMIATLLYFMVIFENYKIKHVDLRSRAKPPVIVTFTEVRSRNVSLQESFAKLIQTKLSLLKQTEQQEPRIVQQMLSLKEDLVVHENSSSNLEQIWNKPKRWIRARQIVPRKAPELGNVLKALQTAEIVKSDVARKGTQLKLMLTLEGGQKVLFKPRRYPRDFIPDGIYAGADRHNGEIVSFHLSRILQLPYVPVTASRIVNVPKEIKNVATQALLQTFVSNDRGNKSIDCFYGECYYCNQNNQACPEDDDQLEGAIILMLPQHYQLHKVRHPWQRTYRDNLRAQWENDVNYCLTLTKLRSNQHRLLDLVDVSIFDFLIGNADRHHYEIFKDVPDSAVLLIDNGKSFGDPNHDELTILYPLLQCCQVRNSTYHHLRQVSSGKLSSLLTSLLSRDLLWPLLTQAHLAALDRRLLMILASIELCFDRNNKQSVLMN